MACTININAQEAGIKASMVGSSFRAPGEAAKTVVADGLLKLVIISEVRESLTYFSHGTSHHLGLDVHYKRTYGPLMANTALR
ncbi:M24 family metallopeptidase [Maribacter sp. X9]|uniref:M24 family metallopeptidase n=1 Tax=Maribacter sp. X9 TaxID=3402159 RepID=UPI003AF3FA26